MTARADIRDLVVVREELADLVAYLNGLPDEVRRAGAFTSYEQRVGELSRELVLTDMLLTLKFPGDNLLVSEKAVDYGRIYDSLSAMTRSYEQAAARSMKVRLVVHWALLVSLVVQWALLVASAASVASALTPAMLLVLTFSTVAASLAGVWVGWLAERTRKQEKAAMRLSALREEITQSFGLAGQVLRPSEYYSASTKRIESLLDEIRTTVEPSRPASSVR